MTVEHPRAMRVLLDSCVPRRLARLLAVHEVRTAPEMGWGDLDNGDLLAAMAGRFDALVTVDKQLPRQQSIAGRQFQVVVIRAKSNRLADLEPLVPEVLRALSEHTAGDVVEVTGDCAGRNRAAVAESLPD